MSEFCASFRIKHSQLFLSKTAPHQQRGLINPHRIGVILCCRRLCRADFILSKIEDWAEVHSAQQLFFGAKEHTFLSLPWVLSPSRCAWIEPDPPGPSGLIEVCQVAAPLGAMCQCVHAIQLFVGLGSKMKGQPHLTAALIGAEYCQCAFFSTLATRPVSNISRARGVRLCTLPDSLDFALIFCASVKFTGSREKSSLCLHVAYKYL